jgi:hypothetical protein
VDYKEIKAAKSPMESPQARPDRNEGSKESKRRVPDQAHDGKHPFYPHLELKREKRSMNHR